MCSQEKPANRRESIGSDWISTHRRYVLKPGLLALQYARTVLAQARKGVSNFPSDFLGLMTFTSMSRTSSRPRPIDDDAATHCTASDNWRLADNRFAICPYDAMRFVLIAAVSTLSDWIWSND